MDNNVICWFEIYVSDMDRAKKFYNAVLGTQFTDAPAPPGEAPSGMKMSFFSKMEEGSTAVSGALVQMEGMSGDKGTMPGTMVYFPCMDCAVEESRVTAAGGQVHQPKMSIGEYGFCSICLDTEGNTIGLYSMQ